MTKNLKRNFIIVLLISFIMMIIILKNDYAQIIKLFSKINIILLIPLILMITYNLVDVLFFKYCFSKKRKYSLWQAFKVQQIGSFFNAVDPFSSGGQFAQTLLFKKQGISYKDSASILMLCFISYQTILVIFTTILLFFSNNIHPHIAVLILIIIGFSVNIAVIIGLLLATFLGKSRNKIIEKIINFLNKIKLLKNPEKKITDLTEWFNSFEDEFKKIVQNKKLLLLRLLIDFIKLVIYFSIPYFIALSLNITMDIHQFIYCFLLSSFSYIVSSIIPLPGSAGGAEATFVSLFYPLFSNATTSIMLLWRFITCYLPMIIGFIIFAESSEFKNQNDTTKKEL